MNRDSHELLPVCGNKDQAPRGEILPHGVEKKNRGLRGQDLAEGVENRHLRPNFSRGKVIEYPRKTLKMPGTLESYPTSQISDPCAQEIRTYLAQLLGTRKFASAGRRGQLLEYLVEHTLAGDAEKINEYSIGIDAFQRPASFDPRIESIVRTEFCRLRQRLKDYYAEDGRNDPIVIDFPPRGYLATFQFCDSAAELESPAVPRLVPAAGPPAAGRRRKPIVLATGASILIAGGAFLLLQHHAPTQSARQPIKALVVLPFENYSPNHQDEYVADSMTEELTNDLSQWRDLRVVARTSAFAFKGKGEDVRVIGQKLNVDAVVEGSFTEEGDRIRITAQLNRAVDGYHLWSHAYETQSKDMLSAQAEVADAITTAIGQVRGGPCRSVRKQEAAGVTPSQPDGGDESAGLPGDDRI